MTTFYILLFWVRQYIQLGYPTVVSLSSNYVLLEASITPNQLDGLQWNMEHACTLQVHY